MNISFQEMYRMLLDSSIDDIVAITTKIITEEFEEEKRLIVFSDYRVEDDFIRLNSKIFMGEIRTYQWLYTGWKSSKPDTISDLTIFLIRKGELYVCWG